MNKDFEQGYKYAQDIKRKRCIKKIKEVLLGCAAVALGIVSIPLLDNDGTLALIMIPLGLFLVVSALRTDR